MQTYSLHTIVRKISDYKVILGFLVVVFGTLINLALNFVNYRVNLINAPIVKTIEAHEQRITSLEQTLPTIDSNTQIIADFINQPKVKLLRPLTNTGSGEKLIVK